MKLSLLLSSLALTSLTTAIGPPHLFANNYKPSHAPEKRWNQLKARAAANPGTNFTFDQLYDLQIKYHEAFIYPNNQAQVYPPNQFCCRVQIKLI